MRPTERRVKQGLCLALLLAALLAVRAEGPAKTGLQPLGIERAEELARSRADEVQARAAAASAALEAADAARASLLPHLSGSVSGAYLANPPAGVRVPAGSLGALALGGPPVLLPQKDFVVLPDAKSTYFKGNLSFTQPLLAWGKIRAGLDLALLEARVTTIGAEGSALDSGRQAHRAYFSALLAQRSARLLAELVGLAEQIVADRRESMDEGFATREDLLSSQADLADLESRLVEAKEGEASSLEALSLLTGLEAGAIELSSDFRGSLPALDEEALKGAAAASSAAVSEAGARIEQARRKLDLERGSALFRPDVSFFASLDASGQDVPFAIGTWMDTWSWDLSFGIAAKADFFDGGASKARREEASSRLAAAESAFAAAGKAARLEARRALEAGRRAQAALAAATAREDWAAGALRNARASAEA
jgi:outer membrane protein TolC